MSSSDDTRDRILSAAGPVFAEKGFQAATVRDICHEAGVNVASVNYYFGDKERLYIETVKRARKIRGEQVPMPNWPPGTPTEEKLRQFIFTMLKRMLGAHSAPWQPRLMMREILNPTAACKELVQEYFRPEFDLLLGILDEVLPPETPLHKRQQIGFSIVGQCVFYRVAGEVVALLLTDEERMEHYSVEELAEHISQMCLASLGLAPPSAVTFGGEPTLPQTTETR
jgi:AcrR family transcriptional regulator